MSAPAEPQDGQTVFDHRTLRAVGQACYGVVGVEWQANLAMDLHVALRTMQRWASGEYDIPPPIWRELVDICRERAVDLKAIAARLEKGEAL